MEIGNITKAATFKSYKNTINFFCDSAFAIIFMRQTLTDNFWGVTQK